MKNKSIPAVIGLCLSAVCAVALRLPVNAQTPGAPGVIDSTGTSISLREGDSQTPQSPASAGAPTGSPSGGKANTSDPADPQGNSVNQSSASGYVRPTAKERFHRYVNNTVGPMALGTGVVIGGINQWKNSPREWGQGADAYGKRVASYLGANAARQTTNFALSEALKLDDKFYRSNKHGFKPRAKDAIFQSFMSRTTTGKLVFSAPKMGGYLAGGFAPLIWLPKRYDHQYALRSAGYSLLSSAGFNLLREFILRKF